MTRDAALRLIGSRVRVYTRDGHWRSAIVVSASDTAITVDAGHVLPFADVVAITALPDVVAATLDDVGDAK